MAENDGISCSTPAFRLRWDVFLSFRGEDTRDNFTNRIYSALERNGVRVFRDNDGMTQGDSLDPTLFDAIEDSAASITIISPNYASSRWCLEELAKICDCRRLILPVFYRVDPSDVRRQRGPFEDHFRTHEKRFGEEMVVKWRKAMKKVGGISGWVFQNGAEEKTKLVVLPTSFSNLSSLKEFNARAWRISGKIPDDFEKLSSLETLNLSHNDICSLPSSLRGLSILKELRLNHCKELKVLPPLPSSLVKVNAANCTALESISDLSTLESLEDLHLTNCDKLVDIPGLERLNSLRRLHIGGCNSCSSAVKGKLDKVALRNLYNLSMPGSEIPNWFTPEVASFSKRKNLVIKGVIMAVVVSINHQIVDDLRDELPVVVDIQAKILRLNEPVFTTVLKLEGVPKTHEDQVYLCRYHNSTPLVLILKDGDKIQVAMQNPPYVKGVELKKSGIYLIFENDDDYGGDEESLDVSQQSVSQKLTRFFGSSEGEHL